MIRLHGRRDGEGVLLSGCGRAVAPPDRLNRVLLRLEVGGEAVEYGRAFAAVADQRGVQLANAQRYPAQVKEQAAVGHLEFGLAVVVAVGGGETTVFERDIDAAHLHDVAGVQRRRQVARPDAGVGQRHDDFADFGRGVTGLHVSKPCLHGRHVGGQRQAGRAVFGNPDRLTCLQHLGRVAFARRDGQVARTGIQRNQPLQRRAFLVHDQKLGAGGGDDGKICFHVYTSCDCRPGVEFIPCCASGLID